MRPSTSDPSSPACTWPIVSMKRGSARRWWPIWTICVDCPRGLDNRVEVRGGQAHRLLAVEVLAGGEHVEVELRVQVARDRGDDRIDAIELEELLPFGGAPRAFLALVRDHFQPALQVRRVDVAHRPDLHARDLEEVLEQDRPPITHTDDPDAEGVVRTNLGCRLAGNKLPGHQRLRSRPGTLDDECLSWTCSPTC